VIKTRLRLVSASDKTISVQRMFVSMVRHRTIQDQSHTDSGSQVVDHVAKVHQLRHEMSIGDAIDVIDKLGWSFRC